MIVDRVRVGKVLELQRRPVAVDLAGVYEQIGIRSFGQGVFHKAPVTGAELGSKRVFWIEPGDLLLSNVFAWEGAIAVASPAEANKIGSHRFMTYTPTDDRIDTGWASWYFRSDPGLELIRKASPGSAGRNRTLAIDRFEALEIPLPPPDEQRRVATHLDEVAAGAHRATALSTKTFTLADALTASIASRPDLSDASKTAAGWTRKALVDVLNPAHDQVRIDPAASYKNLGIYSFGHGVFSKPDIEGLSTSAASLFRVRGGQFIYSRLFAFEGAYSYLPPEFDGYFVSNEFPSFDPDPDLLDSRWLAAYVRSPARWADLAGASKGIGVRRKRVPVEALLNYEIWLPPLETQRATVAMLKKLAQVGRSREESAERIGSLIRSALNAAFVAVN
jgi:type I restriction enzyme, S subunit